MAPKRFRTRTTKEEDIEKDSDEQSSVHKDELALRTKITKSKANTFSVFLFFFDFPIDSHSYLLI
jgi:hypothetical protein